MIVSKQEKNYDLRFVTHRIARRYIELACNESEKANENVNLKFQNSQAAANQP